MNQARQNRAKKWCVGFLCVLLVVGALLFAVVTSNRNIPDEMQSTEQDISTAENETKNGALQMLTLRRGAIDVTAGKEGFYYAGYHPIHTIQYYDEKSQTMIPLCNRPECAHNNSECTAYVANEGYTLFMNAAKDALFLMEQENFSDETNETYPGQNLYRIEPDGSNRTRILHLKNRDLKRTFAGDERYLYFITTFYNEESGTDCYELNRLDYGTGTHVKLETFEKQTKLIGAFDQTILLEQDNGRDIIAATETDILQYDLNHKEVSSILHYNIEDPVGAHTIAYADGENLYTVVPNGEKTAKLTQQDLRSGETSVVTEELPFYGYHGDGVYDAFFADGKMVIESAEEGKQKVFAVDLQTGEGKEITLATTTGIGPWCYQLCGSTQENYLCMVDTVERQGDLIKPDGTKETVAFYAPKYAVIHKDDYINSVQNIIELE